MIYNDKQCTRSKIKIVCLLCVFIVGIHIFLSPILFFIHYYARNYCLLLLVVGRLLAMVLLLASLCGVVVGGLFIIITYLGTSAS
jgi:hypothetical protein